MGRKKAFKTPSSPDPPDDPTKPAHRRAIRLQTVLIASDSPPGSQPQGKFDVEHTDDEGLHFVGYRGGEEWYQDTRAELNFCVCKAITKNELDAEKHGLIRCSNRDCDPGWFHLRCVNLPDHPPMRLAWMCPNCIESQGIANDVNGLWDLRKDGDESVKFAKEWLTEAREEAMDEQRRKVRERLWRELMDDVE